MLEDHLNFNLRLNCHSGRCETFADVELNKEPGLAREKETHMCKDGLYVNSDFDTLQLMVASGFFLRDLPMCM